MKLSLVLLIIGISGCYAGAPKTVHIKGRLLCHGRPHEYAELKLVHNSGIFNENLASVLSDPGGFFDTVAIDRRHGTRIRFWIYHTCWEKLYEPQKCSRLFTIDVPLVFVIPGNLPTKMWDMGEVNLEKWKHNEEYSPCQK